MGSINQLPPRGTVVNLWYYGTTEIIFVGLAGKKGSRHLFENISYKIYCFMKICILRTDDTHTHDKIILKHMIFRNRHILHSIYIHAIS